MVQTRTKRTWKNRLTNLLAGTIVGLSALTFGGCEGRNSLGRSDVTVTGTPIATAYFDGYRHNREFVVVVKNSEGKKYTFFSNHENCGNAKEHNQNYYSPREIILHAQTQAEIADGDNECVIVRGTPYNNSSNIFRIRSLNIEGEENPFN